MNEGSAWWLKLGLNVEGGASGFGAWKCVSLVIIGSVGLGD